MQQLGQRYYTYDGLPGIYCRAHVYRELAFTAQQYEYTGLYVIVCTTHTCKKPIVHRISKTRIYVRGAPASSRYDIIHFVIVAR